MTKKIKMPKRLADIMIMRNAKTAFLIMLAWEFVSPMANVLKHQYGELGIAYISLFFAVMALFIPIISNSIKWSTSVIILNIYDFVFFHAIVLLWAFMPQYLYLIVILMGPFPILLSIESIKENGIISDYFSKEKAEELGKKTKMAVTLSGLLGITSFIVVYHNRELLGDMAKIQIAYGLYMLGVYYSMRVVFRLKRLKRLDL